MVRDRCSSYEIDYVRGIKKFLNSEGHQNPISGSKVTAILLKGWVLLRSVPAACAAGLFHIGLVKKKFKALFRHICGHF